MARQSFSKSGQFCDETNRIDLEEAERASLIYCFFDIEVDGPVPGPHSLLSLACVCCGGDGAELGTISFNLNALDGAVADPDTMKWWSQQPDIWAQLRQDLIAPAIAMQRLVDWLDAFRSPLVFAAHPLILDGLWLDWYLREFTDRRVFRGPFSGSPLFVGAGIDIPSFVQAALGLDYFLKRPDYPASWLGNVEHTHLPVDDARGHANLFFFAKNSTKDRQGTLTSI